MTKTYRSWLAELDTALRANVIRLAEAELTHNDIYDAVRRALLEDLGGEADDRWIWLRDLTDTWVVYEDSGKASPNPGLYRRTYTIDEAKTVTFTGTVLEVVAKTVYEPAAAPAPTPVEEAAELLGDMIPLVETVVRRDGTVPVKIIQEGWGTSGYYSADVLKTSGPNAFPAGTQMYWDHPTVTEETDRPERSLRDLAAVLESDAYWLDDGPVGAALYGDAKVFSEYRDPLEDLASHIGVSIRAAGKAHIGEADGRQGRIIDEIVEGKSIDFVTAAGAGGEVVSLFESARGRGRTRKEPDVGETELREANTKLTTELTEARALGDLAAAERDQLRTDNARLTEGQLLREARDAVAKTLADEKYARLPQVTRARLVESIAKDPPVQDGKLDSDALGTRIEEAVKREVEYLTKVTGRGDGTVTGLGDTPLHETTPADPKPLEDAFGRLGLSESEAKHAAAGRR